MILLQHRFKVTIAARRKSYRSPWWNDGSPFTRVLSYLHRFGKVTVRPWPTCSNRDKKFIKKEKKKEKKERTARKVTVSFSLTSSFCYSELLRGRSVWKDRCQCWTGILERALYSDQKIKSYFLEVSPRGNLRMVETLVNPTWKTTFQHYNATFLIWHVWEHKKTVVLSRCHKLNDMTNWISLSL